VGRVVPRVDWQQRVGTVGMSVGLGIGKEKVGLGEMSGIESRNPCEDVGNGWDVSDKRMRRRQAVMRSRVRSANSNDGNRGDQRSGSPGRHV
jgi:hypothetical protein